MTPDGWQQHWGILRQFSCSLGIFAAGALLAAPGLQADTDAALICGAGLDEVHLRLSIEGLRSTRGNITVTVYPDDPLRFLAPHGKLVRLRIAAQQPTTQACLRLPAAGRFEIAVYHDENDDHTFNRTWLGQPEEGYGFSNNPKTLLGLPSIEAARFTAGIGDTTLDIHLHY